MWQLENSWWETVLRAVIVYGGVFLLFRILGKKQLGQFSPFDFVLLLIVSESISNGLSGGDNSLPGAAISATSLLVISRIFDYASFKSRRFEKLMDGTAKIIVEHGKVVEAVRKSESITEEELKSALRQYGIEDLNQLKYAIIETNGKITVVKKDSA